MTSFLHINDLLNQQQVGDANLHPDGDWVAYTVSDSVFDYPNRQLKSRIWISQIGSTPRPATAEGTRSRHPRWSPDGNHLGFFGRREGDNQDQLYLLDAGWGEASCISGPSAGLSRFAWSPASRTIALLAKDPPPQDGETRKKRGQDQIEYEQLDRFSNLWIYDLEDEQITQLTGDLQIYEFVWSPDGKCLAAIVSEKPYGWSWYENRLVTIDSASGEVQECFRSDRQLTRPAWSPDGKYVSVISCTFSDQGMTGGDVTLIDPVTGDSRMLTKGHPRSYLECHWAGDSRSLICPAYEDAEAEVCRLSVSGNCEVLWRAQATLTVYGSTVVSPDRDISRFVVSKSNPDSPADIWLGEIERDAISWRKVSDHNPGYGNRGVWKAESISWPSFDARQIQGIVLRPTGNAREPLPMITLIHGGPTGVHSFAFPDTRSVGWAHLLAARGYAILLPNPRGSMGFGVDYAEANIEDLGGGDLRDILAGIDYCVAQGIADPERLGVGGWSYGGYLTPWAITQTDRFKAAISGASITNWTSFHGGSTIQGFDETFNRTDPFNADGYYTFRSPVFSSNAVSTPTLFLHGEQDPICPVGQAYEMFRALKDQGVETELIVYPREGHGIREREHVRDLLERVVDWFTTRV